MVGHGGKCWAFVCLRGTHLLGPTVWQNITQWRRWILNVWWGNGHTPTGELLVSALQRGNPSGDRRIVKHRAWDSLAHVVEGSCHLVASWVCPWGSKASVLESSGVPRQWRPWDLLVLGHGLPGATAAAAVTRALNLWVAEVLGTACWACASRATAAAAGKGEPRLLAYSFCYPWSSRSPGVCLCRGTSFLGTLWWGAAGHVPGRNMEVWVPVWTWKQDLPPSMLSNGAWSCMETLGEGIWSVELQVIFPWLVAFLFVYSERTLLLASYRTLWVSFGPPQSYFFRIVGLGMSTIYHLAWSSQFISFQTHKISLSLEKKAKYSVLSIFSSGYFNIWDSNILFLNFMVIFPQETSGNIWDCYWYS
jgi:hypothetical protein